MLHSEIMKEHLLLCVCIYITTFILSVKTFLKCHHIPGTYFETIPATPVALIVIQLQIFVSKLLILNFYQVYFFIHLPSEPKERWKFCLISKWVTWTPDQEYYLEINWAQPLMRPITVGLQKLKNYFEESLKPFFLSKWSYFYHLSYIFNLFLSLHCPLYLSIAIKSS